MRILLPTDKKQSKVIFQPLILVGLLLILTWSCTKEDPPTLTTLPVTEITGNTAQSGGNITDDGGAPVTSRGVVWSTSENPTVDHHVGKTTDGQGTGEFTSSLTELSPGTTYYVRAYAVNSAGTAYGNQLEFTTIGAAPTATTNDASDITSTSAVLNGSVNPNELSTVVSFEYGITAEYGNEVEAEQRSVSGSENVVVSAEVFELSPGTTYYFRVKAENEVEITFGDDMTFNTQAILPTVTTKEVSEITYNSAYSGGDVFSDGGAEVTARGVVWAIFENPTVDSHDGKTSDGTGTGEFISELTELSPITTYHVRAYAVNSVGTAYDDQKQLTTKSDVPTVITSPITDITDRSASGGGEITDDGGSPVTSRGVVWNTVENPTVDDNEGMTNDGEGIGEFVSELTELTAGSTYYLRAYATNIAGTAYGDELSFTTTVIVTGITLNTSSINFIENETYELIATVLPTNADNKNVTWSGSNSNVATVESDGIVTAIAIGSVEIKATTVDGNYTATCSISVVPITDKISLSFTTNDLVIFSGFFGYVRGEIISSITNNSSKSITLVGFEVIHQNPLYPFYPTIVNKIIKASTTDLSLLGELEQNQTKSIKTNLGSDSRVYGCAEECKPIYKWKFFYNNKEYNVYHEYNKGLNCFTTFTINK